VLAFHAAPALLPGGFMGVDVFFVISGFVITALLLRELEARGRIDLPTFYARRVRRLLPAAVLALGATLLLSAWIIAPLDLPRVAGDGVASALSVSNIRFALAQGSYFEAMTSPSPFLHYWSLSVEEQFYLVWPVTLLLAFRMGRRRSVVAAVVLAIAIVSLGLAIVLTDTAASWAFYSLPTRAWQLAAGGLLAVAALHRFRSRVVGAALAIGAWAGLAAVIGGALFLTDGLAYPGAWALIPTVGAAALIAGSDRSLSPGLLLGTAPMRFLGRISYALYLWHWPLLVLPAIAVGGALAPMTTVVLVGLSLAVATLSTFLVEEPIRRGSGQASGRRQAIVVGGLGMALLLSVGVGVGAIGYVTDAAIAESRRYAAADPGDGSVPDDPSIADASVDDEPADALVEMGEDLADAGDEPIEPGAPTGDPTDDAGSPLAEHGSVATAPAPTPTDAARRTPEPSPSARSGMRRDVPRPERRERRPRATPRPTPRPQRQPQARREPPVIRLPGNVKPSLFDATEDEELLRRNGCLHSEEAVVPRPCEWGNLGSRTTIALVGDSHASHWYPALRDVVEAERWRLATFVKVSCPFMDMPVRNLQLKREYRECARFNANVVTQLKRLKPDIVITALSRWQHPTKDGDDGVNAQAAAMARLLRSVPGRKVVIADVPYPGQDVPACLSKHIRDVRDCAVPSWNRVSGGSPARERLAAKAVDGAFLDFGNVICGGQGTCPVVRGGRIIYRDDHHLTATFSRWLAPSMERALTRIRDARRR
jgi:peptidoglycan/LPS O-acetylase OafA/YrhL